VISADGSFELLQNPCNLCNNDALTDCSRYCFSVGPSEECSAIVVAQCKEILRQRDKVWR